MLSWTISGNHKVLLLFPFILKLLIFIVTISFSEIIALIIYVNLIILFNVIIWSIMFNLRFIQETCLFLRSALSILPPTTLYIYSHLFNVLFTSSISTLFYKTEVTDFKGQLTSLGAKL